MSEPVLSEVVGIFYRAREVLKAPVSMPRIFGKPCGTCLVPDGLPCLTGCAAALNEFERLHALLSIYRRPCVVCGCHGQCMPGLYQHQPVMSAGVITAGMYLELVDGCYDDLGGLMKVGGKWRVLGHA